MKISKLFHWLYAMVMFLPLFALGISCAYVIFNKNAYESYYGDTINEIIYNDVGDEDITFNKSYNITTPFGSSFENTNGNCTIYISDFKDNGDLNLSFTPDRILFYVASNVLNIQFRDDTNLYSTGSTSRSFNFDFNYVSETPNGITIQYLKPYLSFIEYNRYSFLDNVFYYSCDQLKQNLFFSWASTSFLAQPITYITGLFGMPSNHIVIYLLSYWLDISIIWLTFDLIMYVPLLVHRWLDKGVLD